MSRHTPHYCEHHPSTIAYRGPVKGKFYCQRCEDIAWAEQAKINTFGRTMSTLDEPAAFPGPRHTPRWARG